MVGPFLLDLNVILAIIDENHIHHPESVEWFEREGHSYWMTCPITEYGAVRVASGTSYPGGAWHIPRVVAAISTIQGLGHHQFVPNDVGLFTHDLIAWDRVRSNKRVTDVYLLATAVRLGAKLATLDRRIDASTVHGGSDHLLVLI